MNFPRLILLRRVTSRDLAQPFASNLVDLVQHVLNPPNSLMQPLYPLRLVQRLRLLEGWRLPAFLSARLGLDTGRRQRRNTAAPDSGAVAQKIRRRLPHVGAAEVGGDVVPDVGIPDRLERAERYLAGDLPLFGSFIGHQPGRVALPALGRIGLAAVHYTRAVRHGVDVLIRRHALGRVVGQRMPVGKLHRQIPPQERIVFVHSWNEWCEGTYLEPDAKNARFFLEQTREAVSIARRAIDEVGPYGLSTAGELLKIQMAKDAGAIRVMHATRMQVHYAWRDLVDERQQRVRLSAELAALRQQIMLMKAQAAAEMDAREQLEASEMDTREQLEAIQNSTSWRMTGPLRRAVRLLRGELKRTGA